MSLVSHNELSWLPQCLSSLERQIYPNLEVIIVDNDSSDGTREWLESRYPRYRKIWNGFNAGFCTAHNQAICEANGDLVLVLNTDVVLEPNFVELLVQAATSHADCAMFTGRLLRMHAYPGDISPSIIDHIGFFPLRNGSHWDRGATLEDAPIFDQSGYVFGVTGAAALYRTAALSAVSFTDQIFDEAFVAYAEDVDLAWRLQLQGGRAWYEAAAIAWHARSVSNEIPRRQRTRAINYQLTKNRWLLVLKNYPTVALLRNAANLLFWLVAQATYLVLFERASLGAVVTLAKLAPRALRARQFNRERRKVTNSEILGWYRNSAKEQERVGATGAGSFAARAGQLFRSTR